MYLRRSISTGEKSRVPLGMEGFIWIQATRLKRDRVLCSAGRESSRANGQPTPSNDRMRDALRRIRGTNGRIRLALRDKTREFRAVKATTARSSSLNRTSSSGREHLSSSDLTVMFALCMGAGSLLLMLLLFWM